MSWSYVDGPPPTKRGKRKGGSKWLPLARSLMKNSGLWVCVDDAPCSLAATIRNGTIRVFQPKGAYEATSRTNADGSVGVYARYVAEVKASNARYEARELWARSQFPELANPFHRHHPRAKDPKKIAGNLHWWTMDETGWNVLMDSLNPAGRDDARVKAGLAARLEHCERLSQYRELMDSYREWSQIDHTLSMLGPESGGDPYFLTY